MLIYVAKSGQKLQDKNFYKDSKRALIQKNFVAIESNKKMAEIIKLKKDNAPGES